MPPSPPYIAIPLRSHIAEGQARLVERARDGKLSDTDKKTGAELLADAYSDVIDHCFVELLHVINRTHPSPMIEDAFKVAEEIKEKIHHALAWVVGFFSAERLVPVIAHFNDLTNELSLHGETRFHVTFPLPPKLAGNVTRALAGLRDGSAKDLQEGTELLIQVIEVALEPLMLEPKRLMKFNFVVNKTLDGLIGVILSLFKRLLRRLTPQIERELYPLVASHLSRFLVAA